VSAQPTGTVTLLFTDIEGSTQLLARLGATRYAELLAQHRSVVREAIAAHRGYEVDSAGDSFFVAFGRADDAVAAAADAQRALRAAAWPEGVDVRVRMGIHTGEPLLQDGSYVGVDVHRAARIMAAAHGGQVLVSGATRMLLPPAAVGELRDLGSHWLKDLPERVSLSQLAIDGEAETFPPIRSLDRTNLPTPAWPVLGREVELDRIRALVRSGSRLVTLTGPGGSGKTRLAIEAAARLSADFPDGVFFAALASLRDADAIRPTVAEAIGLQRDDDPAAWLASRRALVVLDNLEQLPDAGAVVATLLAGRSVILATSRSPLHLSGGHELAVAPLGEAAAVDLFVSRAAAGGRRLDPDPVIRAICARVDDLPLAIELAAARTKLLSPVALLQRLESALPLLAGGAHDLPERQRTLRATIEWSHELLGEAARTAFRRLSIFRGSFTLEAAEAITDADLDTIGALVDQSLVTARTDGRLLMLETIREFARGRLDEAGETRDVALRHARYFLEQLATIDPLRHTLRARDYLDWVGAEEENLATMLDRLADLAPLEAARAGYLTGAVYVRLGAGTEGRTRLRSLLALDELGDAERAMLLLRLAELEERFGDLAAAAELARRATDLSEEAIDRRVLADALSLRTLIAARLGDAAEAVRLGLRALQEAEAIGGVAHLNARMDLGSALFTAGRVDETRDVMQHVNAEARSMGHLGFEAVTLVNLGGLELHERRFDAARIALEQAVELNHQLAHIAIAAWARVDLGLAYIGLERRAEARRALLELLDLVLAAREPRAGDAAAAMTALALAADPADAGVAARLLGAVAAVGEHDSSDLTIDLVALRPEFERRLIDAIGEDDWVARQADGRRMTLEDAVTLARSMAVSPAEVAADQRPGD